MRESNSNSGMDDLYYVVVYHLHWKSRSVKPLYAKDCLGVPQPIVYYRPLTIGLIKLRVDDKHDWYLSIAATYKKIKGL